MIAKVFAVLYSASISLTASLVDSVLDLLSTFIILGTTWAIGMKGDAHVVSHIRRAAVSSMELTFSIPQGRNASSLWEL